VLPRGRDDFVRQIAIWCGFALAYEIARACADRGDHVALANARRVVALEKSLGGLPEVDIQHWFLSAGSLFVHVVDWTYWLSQFVVLSAGLLWVYLRHNEGYLQLRNTLFLVNAMGLVCYVAAPTAPPRLLPGDGLVDTLSPSTVDFGTGFVRLLANPDAAMPSLHAADALVLGVTLASVAARPGLRALALLWPVWVSFVVVATGNHFVLDVAAGLVLGGLGLVWMRTRYEATRSVTGGRTRRLADRLARQ